MGIRVRIIFSIIFLVLLRNAHAQQVNQNITYIQDEIRAGDFEAYDFGYKILKSLPVAKVKGLQQVYINFEGRLLIQTDRSAEGNLYAYAKLVDYQLGGDKFFRDFPIDSLLLPKAISGNLNFSVAGKVVHSVPVELLLSGGVIDLGNTGITPDSLSRLEARLAIHKYIYTGAQYDSFLRTAKLINYYHAYSELLKLMLEEFSNNGISRKQPSAYVFSAWHEISRVNNYVDNYGFEAALNLKEYDPLGLLDMIRKSQRLERRANTVFDLVLQKQDRGSIPQKEQYCKDFVAISEKYQKLATSYQPHIAAAFTEVMRIYDGSFDKPKIESAENFYDVFNKLNLPSTPQCIYGEFVSLAAQAYQQHEYVATLDYLYNASLIDKQFAHVEASDLQRQLYMSTLDKLMSAYLQIAIMAYSSGNFDMADNYYQKAQLIYQESLLELPADSVDMALFLDFIEQQVELAYDFLEDEKYYQGLQLVNRAKSTAGNNDLNKNGLRMDSAYSIAYFGIYEQKLDSIGFLIANRSNAQALKALASTHKFSDEKSRYLPEENDPRFLQFARSLFNLYLSEGKTQLQGRKPEEALFSFLEAQSINEEYLHESYPELDSMVYYATVPVVLDLVKQAELEVWANRMTAANELFNEAVSLQYKYEQQDNPEINAAIRRLKAKMENQVCVNADNRLFGLQQKVNNRLKNRKYAEAESLLREAENIVMDYPDCKLDIAWINSVNAEFEVVFSYLSMEADMLDLIANGNFKEGMEAYETASVYYSENDLNSYGVKMYGLTGLLNDHYHKALVIAATAFWIHKEKYMDALLCLEVGRQHGLAAKETKNLQQEIALGLNEEGADSFTSKTSDLEKYTREEKWYRYFRAVYLSN